MRKVVTNNIGNPTTGMRAFHLDVKLLDSRLRIYEHGEEAERHEDEPLADELARGLLAIPGMLVVSVARHEVRTTIAEAYGYDEVLPLVLSFFEYLLEPKAYVFERRDVAWREFPAAFERIEITPSTTRV